ncbi:MAG: prolipoprotein diacylglyceryl transferase [Bryobacteraceae bacterium]
MFPKLFSIGSFFIPTYGVLVALGFLAGLFVTLRLARRVHLPAEKISNLAIYCALGGIAGAKLFMFLFDWNFYVHNPQEIFTLSTLQAAGVFHGGLLLALLVALLYIRGQQLPLLLTLDTFAPGIALGHAIGRLGCFAAGCCWGKECHLPWAVYFRSQEAAQVPLGVPLHPAQLYESATNLLIFGLLYRLTGRTHRDGQIFGLYLILYGLARFIIEFFRVHEQSLVFDLSLTQWISLALVALGALILWARQRPAALATQH